MHRTQPTAAGAGHHGPIRDSFRLAVIVCLTAAAALASARAEELPYYLEDRGPGMSTSLFGTYIRKGEWLVYPFYEYTVNKNEEYKPSELGYNDNSDHLGKMTQHEALLFGAYGFTDRLMVEIEPAYWTTATLTKADDDPSNQPARIKETGFGDLDMQVRWRWKDESERYPELFSFVEITPPLQKNRKIIGTQDAEYSFGFGVIKGFHWGTVTVRGSYLYSTAEGSEFSEYAVEYLKKISARWRFVGAVEGEQEDIAAIVEAQIHINDRCFIKLNNGFGLTKKVEDFAPEVGVVFSF